MNYKTIYENLVKTDFREEAYTEKHHVIPKCMGGDNSPENLWVLSYKAHQLAHHLLHKIYPDNWKLEVAYRMMTGRSPNIEISSELTKKQWEDPIIREKMCQGISKAMTGKVQSPETIAKRVEKNTGKKRTPQQSERIREGVLKSGVYDRQRRSYLIIHPDGTEENIFGLKTWCRDKGLRSASFFEILRGVRKSYNGYTCQRITTSG